MKVRVIKDFRDRNTKSTLRCGQTIEVTEERFGELTAGPFGVFVEEIEEEVSEKDDEIQKQANENQVQKTELEKLTKSELVTYAGKLDIKLDMNMNKQEMIEILLNK